MSLMEMGGWTALAVRRGDEFWFLEGLSAYPPSSPPFALKDSFCTVTTPPSISRNLPLLRNKSYHGTFLTNPEVIPWSDPDATERRKPKALQNLSDADATPTMLDAFVQRARRPDEGDAGEGGEAGADDRDLEGDVLMNDDGTMSFAPQAAAEDS